MTCSPLFGMCCALLFQRFYQAGRSKYWSLFWFCLKIVTMALIEQSRSINPENMWCWTGQMRTFITVGLHTKPSAHWHSQRFNIHISNFWSLKQSMFYQILLHSGRCDQMADCISVSSPNNGYSCNYVVPISRIGYITHLCLFTVKPITISVFVLTPTVWVCWLFGVECLCVL